MAEEARPESPFDATDRRLMQMLVDDARIPTEELAAALDLTPEEVERRITRLEEVGIIKAYRAVVDPYLYSLYFFENGPLGPKAMYGHR
jgi:Lrp/AsnC family leucine-responsive transcriptional regulator